MVLRLVQPWYEAGSTSGPYQAGISMRLVYYLMSLPGKYWYKGGIGLYHSSLVGSLIAGLGSGLVPWLSETCLDFLHIHPNCSQWCKFLWLSSTL